jgi:radical SAM protein with 4Fe4S-binding SPASM domain
MEIKNSVYHLKELKIEVTYQCPLICIHCSSDAFPNNPLEISRDKIISILNEAVELGVQEIAFSGGEPLDYPYISESIQYCKNHQIKTTLYTSGNVESFEDKILQLHKLGLNGTIFSLYSSKAEEHDQITRTKGSFIKTLDSVKFLIQIKHPTEVHFVALKRNYKRLEELVSIIQPIGVARISVLRFVPQGRGSLLENEELSFYEYVDLKRIIEGLRGKGFDVRTGSPFNFLFINNTPKCNSAIDRLIISPDLKIHPCDAFKQISDSTTNNDGYSSLEYHTLKDCWNHSPFLNEIRTFLTSDFQEPCVSCTKLKSCLSGCLAQKYLTYGGLKKKPDPACLLKK